MVGRCETCRWWDAVDPDYGLCLMVRRWDHNGTPSGRGQEHPESKAQIVADVDGVADLLTFPDFGCIQWETRDP